MMLNQFGVNGINFATRNLNFMHHMKKQETDIMTVCGVSSIQVYRAADRGKYKGKHRLKLEVQIPEHVFTEGGSLFDVPVGVVLAIPQENIVKELHDDAPPKSYYTVTREDGDVTIFPNQLEYKRGLHWLYEMLGEDGTGKFVVEDRAGEATEDLEHVVKDLPLDVVHTLLSWGKVSVPTEMNGMSLELFKLLNDRYEAAEKVTIEGSQEATEGADTDED